MNTKTQTRLAARFDGNIGFYSYRRLTAWHRYSAQKKRFGPEPPHEHDRFEAKTVSAVEIGADVEPMVVEEPPDYGDLGHQWIYVFHRTGPLAPVKWFAEVFHPGGVKSRKCNPMTTKAGRLSWSPPAKDDGPDEDLGHLPGLVALDEWLFTFIGVPFRLEDACIDMLEQELHRLCKFEPLSVWRYDRFAEEHGHRVPFAGKDFVVPVAMPLRVCQMLSTDVRVANSLLANLNGLAGELDGGPLEPSEDHKKYVFCKGLTSLMTDPEMSRSLRGAMAEDKKHEPDRTVADHETLVRAQTLLVHCLSADLARVYDSDLNQILLNGYIDADGSRALEVDAEIMLGLTLHQPGLMVLLRMFKGPDPRFKHTTLFTRPGNAGARERKLASSAKTAAVSIGAAFLKAAAWRHKMSTKLVREHAETLLDLVARGVVGNVGSQARSLSAIVAKQGHPVGVEIEVSVRRLHLSAGDISAFDKAVKVAGAAGIVLDTINLGLALSDFDDAAKEHPEIRLQKSLTAIGSGISLLAGIVDFALDLKGARLGWRLSARMFGLVGTVLVSLATLVDMERAYARGDDDAGDAMFLSVSASLAGSMLVWAAMLFELAPLHVIGMVALALGAIGAVLAELLTNSELEVLVKRSRFGTEARQKGSAFWSPVGLEELADSWDAQIVALRTLLSAFAVGFGDRATMVIDGDEATSDLWDLRIFVGNVDGETSFDVVWTWQATRGSGSVSKTLKNTAEEAGLHSKVRFHEKSGAPYVDIEAPTEMLVDARAFIHSDPLRELHGRVAVVKNIRVGTEVIQIPADGGLEWEYTWPGVHPDMEIKSHDP